MVCGDMPPHGVSPGRPFRRPGAREREKQRILVVDDDPGTLRDVRDALSDAGYAPLVTGGADGLAGLIRTEKPDLLLHDVVLASADGI